MNKNLVIRAGALALGVALTTTALAQETKTDIARDIFVEYSATNFVITAKAPESSGKHQLAFHLSAPSPGDYTLICFIDGRPGKPQEFKAPGKFELSTRGLAPGNYRVTLQLVDGQGRVGRVTKALALK